MNPVQKLNKRAQQANSLVCVGLDADLDRIPKRFLKAQYPQFEFNQWIIDQTHEYALAYKPNLSFYEDQGEKGWTSLRLTMEYLQAHQPDIFTIIDAKLGDVGQTNTKYVKAFFDQLGFDGITLHVYLGAEALQPFLEREDKASILLCRTSNPGAGEFQDLEIDHQPLWQVVVEHVRDDWNRKGNCMMVAGATYPKELGQIRELVGEMWLLVPGVGAQGGSVKEVVTRGLNQEKTGVMINSSRGIIFADDPGQAAQQLRDEVNEYR